MVSLRSAPNSLRSTLWYSIVIIVALIVFTGAYLQTVVNTTSSTSVAADAAIVGKVRNSLVTRDGRHHHATSQGNSVNANAPHNQVQPPPPPKPENFAVKELVLTAQPTAKPVRRLSDIPNLDQAEEEVAAGPSYLRATWAAVKAGYLNPEDEAVIPVFVTPLFHDGRELTELLNSIDVPVRVFEFIWNSDSSEVAAVLQVLQKLPIGVRVHHHPDNIGFSGAVNTGIVDGNATLSQPEARWYFIVNADTQFPAGNLRQFSTAINSRGLWETHGLVYGPRQDHFAFVITQAAVQAVGLMDETFYPGYMEDIDFHWRVMLAGLPQEITRINFIHKQSVNMRKPGTGTYREMLVRASNGWEYGWMKWGDYGVGDIERPHPPSGWKTPFNIPNAPLSLWRIDPGHRECIRTGRGTYHISSSTCWYNGTVLYEHKDFPLGETLTPNLLHPHRSGAWSKHAHSYGRR